MTNALDPNSQMHDRTFNSIYKTINCVLLISFNYLSLLFCVVYRSPAGAATQSRTDDAGTSTIPSWSWDDAARIPDARTGGYGHGTF